MTAVTSEMKPAHPVTAWLGPAPGPTAGGSLAATGRAQTSSVVSDRTTSPARQIKVVTGPIRLDGATTRLTQSFVITQPLAQVWARLADLGSVVPCMPGAALDGPLRDDGAFTAHLALRLGPIRTTFAGEGIFSRDDNAKTCRIQGRGRDRSGPSAVQGEVVYRATAVDGAATRVDAEIGYSLAGPLAQFGRPGLVHSLVAHFGEIFALNLDAAVAGRAPPATGGNELGLWSLLRALVRRWRNRLTGQHR